MGGPRFDLLSRGVMDPIAAGPFERPGKKDASGLVGNAPLNESE